MSELLVYNRDTLHINDALSYRKGDIVSIMPEGWKWGLSECLPKFYIVKTIEELSPAFVEPIYDRFGEIRICRRYRYNLTSLDSLTRRLINHTSQKLHIPYVSLSNIEDKSTWL